MSSYSTTASAPSVARQFLSAPIRCLVWLVATPIAVALFVVWTLVCGVVIVFVTSAWHAVQGIRAGDGAERRWRNPGLRLAGFWAAGFRVIALAWGLRCRRTDGPPPVPDGTVRLYLLTHPPAVPAILLFCDVMVRLSRYRLFAIGKRELTSLLRVPGSALGVVVPIDRAAGAAAAAAVEEALVRVPLDGAAALIFPEGHRVTRSRAAGSAIAARERGFEPMENLLEPRPRGSLTLVRALAARARAEGLRFEVIFGTCWMTRSGWGELFGPALTMGSSLRWTVEDVTDEALAASVDLPTFATWLRGRFDAADEKLVERPFIDPA